MAIGQELLDIPFAEMLRNLAFAIAEGQLELDRSSIETLKFLLDTQVDIVPEIAEILEPVNRTVTVGNEDIAIPGVNIRASGAKPIKLNLLQAGLLPTFYQFTEATIEVKLSISIKSTTNTRESNRTGNLGARVSRINALAFCAPVNFRTANTYSYTAEGASVMRATMRPVPPPARLIPSTVTVNALVDPPTVTRNG